MRRKGKSATRSMLSAHGKDTESKKAGRGSAGADRKPKTFAARQKCGLAGDYGIKDRTDRGCKVELLSKTGRWAM